MIGEPQSNPQVSDSESDKCPNCGNQGSQEPHVCPFAEEIYGDETPCNCCDHCCYECAMDI